MQPLTAMVFHGNVQEGSDTATCRTGVPLLRITTICR